MTAATVTTRTISADNLIELGFSDLQVSMLKKLKANYSAFSEQFESEREYQQVQFLKWRYERGEIERG